MGAWGKMPWENDGAADWFGSLFDKTKLAKHVENTLKLDAANSHEEIRAAAGVLLFLGRDYIWPDDLDQQLMLAANKLDEIIFLDVVAESPESVEDIRSEIEELRSRIKPAGLPQPSQTPPRKWWQFWT